MKLIKIDETILVQKKQDPLISTFYFLMYVGFFILFLAYIINSAWIHAVSAFVVSVFCALRWFSGAAYYTLKLPKVIQTKIFKIPLGEDSYTLFVASSLMEAELFATLNGLSIEGIEMVTEHAYNYS